MISMALVADAVIGNVQEKSIRNYSASNSEVVSLGPFDPFLTNYLPGSLYASVIALFLNCQVLYSYSLGSLYILIGLLFSGQFFEAFYFFAEVRVYGFNLTVQGLM